MGAPDLLARIAAAGVTLTPLPDGRVWAKPASRLTDELRALIRAHKGELLAVLSDALPDPATAVRFGASLPARCAAEAWALDVLDAHLEAQYGAHVDTESDPVRVTVAIRGGALCEVWIPRIRWDGVLFLELLEKFGGTVDATRRAIH